MSYDAIFNCVVTLQIKVLPSNILSIHGSKVMLFNIDRNDLVDKEERTHC